MPAMGTAALVLRAAAVRTAASAVRAAALAICPTAAVAAAVTTMALRRVCRGILCHPVVNQGRY